MMFLLKMVRGSLLALISASVLFVASGAEAGINLEQFEFQGRPGTDTTLGASFVASGLTSGVFAESSVLTAAAGTNSINSSGWNLTGAYYSVGFTVNSGYTATIDQITLTSRSSGTGPGFINVLASVAGGAFTKVGSIIQSGTTYNDEILSISTVTATQGQSVVFEFVAANQTNAAGTGSIGSTGTFRIGDYAPAGSGIITPFTLSGSITPNTAVPEPAAISLLVVGLAGVGIAARRRHQAV